MFRLFAISLSVDDPKNLGRGCRWSSLNSKRPDGFLLFPSVVVATKTGVQIELNPEGADIMSIMSGRRGERLVLEKVRSLRGDEALRERDRAMYAKYVEGHTYQDVAILFNRTKGLVCQRFKAMPASVKLAIRKDVVETRRQRLENLARS